MTRSATDVMQEIVFSAVLDAITALKTASKGLPNTLLRDLNAVHANTTFADLPPELQAAITASVRSAFTRLLKEGYSVSPGRPEPQQRPAPRRDDQRERRPGPRRDGPAPGPGGGKPPANRGRPNRNPKPRGS